MNLCCVHESVRQIEGSTSPWGIPQAFDAIDFHGCGEFSSYTYGVGNLNSNLDFVRSVLVVECGLKNHGGGRLAVQNDKFKHLYQRKDCCFVTSWIKK